MNYFLKDKNVLLLRYLDFRVFTKSKDFKICDVIRGAATCWKLHLCLFFLNSKYYQNETWSNNSVLYDDNIVQQNLAIFNS